MEMLRDFWLSSCFRSPFLATKHRKPDDLFPETGSLHDTLLVQPLCVFSSFFHMCVCMLFYFDSSCPISLVNAFSVFIGQDEGNLIIPALITNRRWEVGGGVNSGQMALRLCEMICNLCGEVVYTSSRQQTTASVKDRRTARMCGKAPFCSPRRVWSCCGEHLDDINER